MDERAILASGARQHGVVTVAQLRSAGFGRDAIRRRCRTGWLRRLHRGVYLVGHAVAPELAVTMAACFACGPGSVVSHHSAARLWGLPILSGRPECVDISVVRRDPGNRPGIHIHRVRALRASEVRRVDGIPATAPGRTLVDLAACAPFDEVEVAFIDARSRGLLHERDLTLALQHSVGRPGAPQFRRLVEMARDSGLTRSEAERKLLALVRAAALPIPKVNVRVGRLEVDFLWPDQKVVVEVDGFAFHAGWKAFERDRERDAGLTARGYVVLRVTWRQLVARREAVTARIAGTLAVRGVYLRPCDSHSPSTMTASPPTDVR